MALDGTTAILETQLLPKEELYKRWDGATHEEIAGHFNKGELRAYERHKGPINGILWCKPGHVYYQDRMDYSNPGLYEYSDDYCDYFLLEDVVRCEIEHPEYIGNVTPESLGLVQSGNPESKTDWRDCNVIQDTESRPTLPDNLCRNNIVLVHDADGTICPPHMAALPLKIFFTEMPKPDDGDFYTSHDLMERYKLGPAEFVEYLMHHKDLFPHGVPEWFYIRTSHH